MNNEKYEFHSLPLNKLTKYLIEENGINPNKEYSIERVSAKELICPLRFDLMAKWIYIDSLERGLDLEHATQIYRNSIFAFSCGTFNEPGMEGKDSFDKYIEQFNDLINDIRQNGFDDKKSIIPVGKNNVLLDGAHRVVAAAYYGKEVTIVHFPELTREFNYTFFRQRLMSDLDMSYMAKTYVEIKDNCFFACVWPIASRDKHKEVRNQINLIGEIVYEQDVYLTYRGMCNFFAQIYGHQKWTGGIENHFEGVKGKVNACYNKDNPVHTIVFTAPDLDAVIRTKERIRDIYSIGNDSIHISDNSAETLDMAELLYNANSVQMLNVADMFKYRSVFDNITNLKKEIIKNKSDIKKFIITADIKEICGISPSTKFEYLADDQGWDKHLELVCEREEKKELIYNPSNYFWFNGMKFITIVKMLDLEKSSTHTTTLMSDLLLRKYTMHPKSVPLDYREDIKKAINQYKIKMKLFGNDNMTYKEYKKDQLRHRLGPVLKIYRKIKGKKSEQNV